MSAAFDSIPKKPAKWMLVLPPEGAARQVGEKAWEALTSLRSPQQIKLFDTKLYLDAFDRMLKKNDDNMAVDLTNQALIIQCLDFEATHLLVIALAPITLFSLNLLKRQNIITLHWFIEDFREAKYWRAVLAGYQYFLAIQKGPIETACRSTGTHYHYLPTAFVLPPQPRVKPWLERPEYIGFIGFPSLYRIKILERLYQEGLPLKVAGAGWEEYQGPLESCLIGKGWFGTEAAFELLEGSRIGLHLPSEDPELDRDNCHLSPRVFDILAAGCVLLTEAAPLIQHSLVDCLYFEFKGMQEVSQAARRALTEGLPEGALEKNRNIILREHTYTRRMTEILSLGL